MAEYEEATGIDRASQPTLFPGTEDSVLFDWPPKGEVLASPLELHATEVTLPPAQLRPNVQRGLGERATMPAPGVETLVPMVPAKTPRELYHTLRHMVPDASFDDSSSERPDPYGELGGGLRTGELRISEPLRRRAELVMALEGYQDWYAEFDRLANMGVFEIESQHQTMPLAERSVYFADVFRALDTVTNRIGLIQREPLPSANPDITQRYGHHSDDAFRTYATRLANLRRCALSTSAVQAMYAHFGIHGVESEDGPMLSRELLAKTRRQIQGQGYRTGRVLLLNERSARYRVAK